MIFLRYIFISFYDFDKMIICLDLHDYK